MTRIDVSADLRPLAEALSMSFECLWSNDAVQDIAAELHQELSDLLMIGSDLDPLTRRECEKSAFEHVQRLRRAGAVVTVGLYPHSMTIEGKPPFPWTTLYVLVAKEADAKDFAIIPRRQTVRFT